MKKIFKKSLSVILTLNLLIQSYTPFLITPVYADDSTPSAAIEATPTPTSEPTPEVTPTPTVEATPTPEITATPTPTSTTEITPTPELTPEATPTPTDIIVSEVTPSPTIELTPTVEITPTISPEVSSETSPNTDSQAPPASDNSQSAPDTTPVTVPESLTIATQLEQTLAPVPTLSTDKSDYFPTDIAYISGSNFLPNTSYTLHIMSSDMPFVSYKVEVTSDEFGHLSYAYQLDGNYRPNYGIEALDASDAVIASYLFTDTKPETIKICHAHDSQTNPYNEENPDKSADLNGHNNHNGPVWYSGIADHSWGDIIPSFTYQSSDVVGSHQVCPNGYPLSSSLHPGYCYKSSSKHDWPSDYKIMETVLDYGLVTHTYPGKNWTTQGQAIWNNNCEVPPTTAKITVTKVIINDNGGAGVVSNVALYLDGNSITSGVQNTTTVGLHTISEAYQGGYLGTITGDCAANGTITLAAGDIKSCTITNNDIAPKLHLRKIVINDNGGTAKAVDWTLSANGTGNNDFSGNTPVDSGSDLKTDTFILGESGPSGYSASSWSCTNPGLGGSIINGSSIQLYNGGESTCTITNDDQPGTLIVKKTIIGGTKTAKDFSFKVNGGSSTAFEVDGQNDLTVNSGTYSVVENSDPDYAVSYSNCSNLNIGLGGTATCTITNTRKTGNLILNKIIFGGGPAVDSNWSFTIKSLDGLTTYGVLTDNGVNNSINLPTGSYKVTESTGVLGYSLTAVGGACSGLSGQSANASVAVGDQTCSFTNTRDTGSVRVNKWTDINGDGDYNDHDEKSNTKANQLGFRWSLDGGSNKNMGDTLSDIPTTIANTVTHTITEKEVNGYHLVGWSTNGSCSEPNTSTITPNIVKGQTATITLCNVRDTGTITIVKDAHPESSQQFKFESDLGDFTLIDNHSEKSRDDEDHDNEHHYSNSKKFDRVNTGEYDFSEKDTSGWTLTGITCKGGEDIKIHKNKLTIDLNNGEDIVCTFHNSRNPIITVDKVTNPSGSEQSFAFTVTSQQKDDNDNHEENDDHDNNQSGRDDKDNHDGHDEDGHSLHFNLADETKPKVVTTFSEGEVTITEGQVPGWETTDISCTGVDHEDDKDSQESHVNRLSRSQDENNQNSVTFHAHFGDEIKCTFTNAAWGNVIVTKYNDKNSNGFRDRDEEEETYTEEVLNGWQINLSGEESQKTGEESEVDGVAEFNKIKPGHYTLSEDLESHPGHWTQTGIRCDDNQYDQRISQEESSNENSYDLNLAAGQTIRCEIGNHFTDPRLELTKSNNATGDLHAGDAVEYRLKLEVLDNDANDIEVTDLLPRGFKYRAGSYQVWKNGLNVTGSYTEPTYHSPGTWSLGDNSLGDKYELVYTADIAGDQDPGLYHDLSWAKGTSPMDSSLTILATVPGTDSSYFADSFAGTHVNVVKDQTRSDDYSVEKKVEGQVLGASTDLPATGANELWLLGALLSLYFGLKLVRNTK